MRVSTYSHCILQSSVVPRRNGEKKWTYIIDIEVYKKEIIMANTIYIASGKDNNVNNEKVIAIVLMNSNDLLATWKLQLLQSHCYHRTKHTVKVVVSVLEREALNTREWSRNMPVMGSHFAAVVQCERRFNAVNLMVISSRMTTSSVKPEIHGG